VAKHKLDKVQKKHAVTKAKHDKDSASAKKTKGSTYKLALPNTIKSMLCTNFCISKNKAEAFFRQAEANINNNDNQSKE